MPEDEDDDVDDDFEATQQPGQPTVVTTPSPSSAPVIQGCEMQRYTTDDLWVHDSESSCWYGLYGVVYDVTDFIFKHPGGWGEILPDCGTDATDAYENERFHNVNLLIEIGFDEYIIGRQGSTSGIEIVPCDEVGLVSVGLSSRN
jgi:cytochrome b involved in lipid metabolism